MAKSGKTRYPALRIIAAWYKVFGCVVGLIMALAGLIAVFGDGDSRFGIGLIIAALVFMVLSIAVAEVIQVFLDTENNTRVTAEATQKLVEIQTKASGPNPPPQPLRKKTPIAKRASPEQANSIRTLIRNLHADGHSSNQIAEELRKEGMPTLDGEATWTAEAIEQVLREN